MNKITTSRNYYQYTINKTNLGYEIHNSKNNQDYFVSFTESKGLSCNCPATWKGGTKLCKHKKMIRDLFLLKK